MVEENNKDKPWWKYCLNCGLPIPKIKYDTLGRRNTRTSHYCNMYCRNKYLISKDPEGNKKYHKEYYQLYPEKFKKVKDE